MKAFSTVSIFKVSVVLLFGVSALLKAGTAESERENSGSAVRGVLKAPAVSEEGETGQASPNEKPAKPEGPTRFNKASSLIGMGVVNAKEEQLGQIHDLVVDLEEHRVVYLVFATGGILGIGEKLFALPVDAVVSHPTKPVLIVNVDKKGLVEAKGIDPNRWPGIDAEMKPVGELWGFPPGRKSEASEPKAERNEQE